MKWIVVPGFPELEASSAGQIRRRLAGNSRAKKGHIYAQFAQKTGPQAFYISIRMYKDGKRKFLWVHRLVCAAFNGAPATPKHQAAHKNGNALDNRQKNLYWATSKQNAADKIGHGRHVEGERQHLAKLNPQKVREIRNRLRAGESQYTIADDYGVGQYAIWCVHHRRTWKSVK